MVLFTWKVVKMMIIVVCLFVLCWMPLQIYNFLSEVYEEINLYTYINIIWFCSNWLAMSNSCYNPFIYGLLNAKFKKEFRTLFAMCPCIKDDTKDAVTDYSDDSQPARRSLYGRQSSTRNGLRETNSLKSRSPQASQYTRVSFMLDNDNSLV